jgi:hypothetical protein
MCWARIGYILLTLLEIHHSVWNEAAMSGTRASTYTSHIQILSARLDLIGSFVIGTGGFLTKVNVSSKI